MGRDLVHMGLRCVIHLVRQHTEQFRLTFAQELVDNGTREQSLEDLRLGPNLLRGLVVGTDLVNEALSCDSGRPTFDSRRSSWIVDGTRMPRHTCNRRSCHTGDCHHT